MCKDKTLTSSQFHILLLDFLGTLQISERREELRRREKG